MEACVCVCLEFFLHCSCNEYIEHKCHIQCEHFQTHSPHYCYLMWSFCFVSCDSLCAMAVSFKSGSFWEIYAWVCRCPAMLKWALDAICFPTSFRDPTNPLPLGANITIITFEYDLLIVGFMHRHTYRDHCIIRSSLCLIVYATIRIYIHRINIQYTRRALQSICNATIWLVNGVCQACFTFSLTSPSSLVVVLLLLFFSVVSAITSNNNYMSLSINFHFLWL